MEEKANTHGGKRAGSGRKKIADPKQQVSLYIPMSIVTKHGGMEAIKLKLEKYILQAK